ncbi:MAG: hypothetical protein ACX939_07695, partial [Hyphococcus sp.]
MDDQERRERDPLEFQEAAPTASSVANMIGTRNLLIIIVTMPFVFLVVVMAIIAVFGRPAGDAAGDDRSAVISTPAAAAPTADNAQRVVLPIPAASTDAADAVQGAIALPAGAEAGAISLDGDRLAVRIESEDGAMIVIYDLAQNAVVQTVPLVAG